MKAIFRISSLSVDHVSYREKYGLRERIPKLMSSTILKYSDTGQLMRLLSSLAHLDSQKLHVKINNYMKSSTGSLSFIIESVTGFDYKVKAIGPVPLEKTLVFEPTSSFFQKRSCGSHQWITRSGIEGQLCFHLEDVLFKECHENLQNCLLIPIIRPHKFRIVFLVGLVNARKFFRCEEFYNGVVQECFSHCIGLILSASNYEEKRDQHDECKTMVEACVEIMSFIGTDMLHEAIERECMSLFGASNCLLYTIDTNLEASLKSSIITSEELSFNKDGTKLITLHSIKTCKPHYWNNLIDEPLYGFCGPGIPPSNLLSFIIQSGSRLIALMELYHKAQKGFGPHDLETSQLLSRLSAKALTIHENFMAFTNQWQQLTYVDCFLLRRVKITDNIEIVKHIQQCELPLSYHRFSDVRFDPFLINEDHVLCVCFKIFKEMGLLKTFNVKKDKFARFLLFVKNAYQALPFHNWTQAFATFHFIFAVLNTLKLVKNKFITLLEAFALLLAGLCHCLDSRGYTTMFTLVSGTVQGSLFSSPGSISQMHYSSQAFRLMNFSESNFLESMSDQMYYSLALLLIEMIKDTDITNVSKKVEALDELGCKEYDFQNWKHRRLLHNIIMNVSQMNFIVKPWSYCRTVGENCFEEFYRKGDLTYASGVYEMTDLNEDILKLPDISMQFIESVGLPAFRVFVKMFPVMSICIEKIEGNLKNWKEEKERILAKMVKEALGGGGGEGDEIVLINPFIKN